MNNDPRFIRVDVRDIATILAALRHYQENKIALPPHIKMIADNNGESAPLRKPEIDELCERFNFAPESVRVVLLEDQGVIYGTVSNVSLEITRIDFDAEAYTMDQLVNVSRHAGQPAEAACVKAMPNRVDPDEVFRLLTLEPMPADFSE